MNRTKLSLLLCFTLMLLTLSAKASQKIDKSIVDSLRPMATDNPDVVDKAMDKYIPMALAQGDSFLYAKLIDTKALAKRNLGKYAEAIDLHKKAYDIFYAMNNKTAMASCLNGMSIVMIRTSRFDEAKKYLLEAKSYLLPTDSSLQQAIRINLGYAYDYTDDIPKAIESYKAALNYVIKGDDYSMSVVLHDIGVCYSVIKDYKQCEAYEFKALEYAHKSNGPKDNLGRIEISMGSMYLDQGMIDKARIHYEKGAAIAEEINSVTFKEECYTHLVDFYITIKDSKKALEYFEKFGQLKQEIYNKESATQVAEAEAKFKVTLQKKEIENLKISKKLSDLKEERNNIIRNVMMVVILLALVLLVAVYRNYQLRKKNESLLIREKQLIESEKRALEKNYEYLQNENMLARFEILKSQVSPHFLFNTLNALSYLIESDPDKAVQFTNAFSQLYRTILELKDQNLITLQSELGHVESYFFLQLTRFGKNLHIDKNVPPDYDEWKLPPFSIQLAVENAINHNIISENKPLKIKIYLSGEFLVIENNLQEKVKTVKSTSMGIANIKARYSFFTNVAPEFIKSDSSFIVKLPLLNETEVASIK